VSDDPGSQTREALAGYLAQLRKPSQSEASVFWDNQLASFREALSDGADPAELTRLLGYGFEPSSRSTRQGIMEALKLRKRAKLAAKSGVGKLRKEAGKEAWEHMARSHSWPRPTRSTTTRSRWRKWASSRPCPRLGTGTTPAA
jgi:hypothetical protein